MRRCDIPNQPSREKEKVSLRVEKEVVRYLEGWAARKSKEDNLNIKRTDWMVSILKNACDRDKRGEVAKGVELEEDDFDQIKKFIALLAGEEDRNGISFANLEKVLNVPQEKLNDLYKMVFSMRAVRAATEEAPAPEGFSWKLIQDK